MSGKLCECLEDKHLRGWGYHTSVTVTQFWHCNRAAVDWNGKIIRYVYQ